jgi:hypothetical protein
MVSESIIQLLNQVNPVLASAIVENPYIFYLLILQAITKLVFYPLALFASAKRNQKTWFVVLFICLIVLNDFALIAILYLIYTFWIQKKLKNSGSSKKKKL